MEKKSFALNRFDIIVLLVGAVILIIAGFVDLQLSISVVNRSSIFGAWVETFGIIPGYLLILWSLVILPHRRATEEWVEERFNHHNLLAMGVVLIWMIPSFLIAHQLTRDFYYELLLMLVIPVPFAIIYRLYSYKITEQMLQAANITVKYFLAIPLIFIVAIKSLWGRLRFRQLDADHSQFTPWYHPNGFNGNQSFPSGHAAMAWSMICIVFFFKEKRQQLIALALVIIWAMTVSIGRIVYGAHYLSDVTFSGIIALLGFNYVRKNNNIVKF